MKRFALIIVLALWLGVLVIGRGRYDFDPIDKNFSGTLDVKGVATITGFADGGLTNYDLKVGDTTTPDYGMFCFGNAVIGRTSYKAGNVDLDGSVLFRNLGGPITGLIEFLWEEGNGATRFALPTSGVGNATYNPRSMLIAGPAPADTNMVTVGYWQTNNNIFHNLACDTSGTGADLGVQNDLEVEGDIFTDSIKESTPGAGVTLDGNTIITGTLTVNGDQSGATDHVFDDYDDIVLLEKWRNGESLPFKRGDILNRDRLLRDAIIQQQKQINELIKRLERTEK